MDPLHNPYAPGAGAPPPELAGRDHLLKAASIAIERIRRGRFAKSVILVGLRGVGKTVLLTQLRHDAQQREWVVVQVEGGTGRALRELLGEGLYDPLTELRRPSPGRRLLRAIATALSFKASYDHTGTWTFGMDLSGVPSGGADSGVLETDLKRVIRDVSLAAGEDGVGLAILIDEAQDLSADELTTLAVVAQAAAQDNWPVLFGLAGLPSLPQTMAEAKSYTERFHFVHVERLSEEDARVALTRPAAAEGVEWSPEALGHVVASAGRYPYFIQQFGQETWNESDGSPISLEEARRGVLRGQNQLDNGFFRARWDRTTSAEKRYLRAMCPEGDEGVGSGEVATRLGKKIGSIGPVRANLMHKGLIYAPDHGVVRFTVPGMADFIARQKTD